MSMLQHYFAAEVHVEFTKGLFDQFNTANRGAWAVLTKAPGAIPCYVLSHLMYIKETSYEAAVNQIRILMHKLYREHKHVLKSDKIDRRRLSKISKVNLDGSDNNEELQDGLYYLS